MKATVLVAPGEVEVRDDLPEPEPAADEVVVEVRAVGLCGSDLAVFEGIVRTPRSPWIMGHEGGGEIVAVGSDVRERHVGQRVVVEPNYPCLACRWCRDGVTSSCPSRRVVGMNEPGLLQERVAVPARFAHPVPDSFDDALLACIEPLAVARSAVRRAGVWEGASCLVVGAGSQGLLVCASLLAQGATPHVVEPHEGRREVALALGAHAAADDATYPFVFNTTDAAAAWDLAVSRTDRSGTLAMIGLGVEPVALSTRDLVRRQLRLHGMLIYDHPRDFHETIMAVRAGSLRPEAVLQASYTADAAKEAFDAARRVPGKSWISLADWHEASPPGPREAGSRR